MSQREIKIGDWIQYNIGTPHDEIAEVVATQQGYYVVKAGVCVYPSQIIETRSKEEA